MESLSVCTPLTRFRALAWDSLSAKESWSAPEGRFGSSLRLDGVRHFSLRSEPSAYTEVSRDMGQFSILLIEDNPADVGLIREALLEHHLDCDLTVIGDGERAIQFVGELEAGHAPCPDLVLLDLNVPRKPGHQVLEHMRASRLCANLPIIVLTSSDAQDDRELAKKLGATRYLRKPIRLDEFLGLGAIFGEILRSGL